MIGGRHRCPRLPHAAAVLVLAVSCAVVAQTACESDRRRGTLPAALTDREFWRLISDFSEPPGTFESDNLVSNEVSFVHAIRLLRQTGGVYIGVGPEQNFSYIAKLRPAMAFIIDIRRENRNLHLLYKALFEVSTDRADFVSRLFSRERPPGLGPKTSIQEIFDKYEGAKPVGQLYDATVQALRERLVDDHGFPLAPGDLAGIEHVLRAFFSQGPDIHYVRSAPGYSADPSYRALMTATDITGQNGSYLLTEDRFTFVKRLHASNLIVPVVGDFAGPRAIRSVGDYVRQHAARVSAFYGSNVEVYLSHRQTAVFCASLATLPYDSRTWFIASKGLRPFRSKLEACVPGAH